MEETNQILHKTGEKLGETLQQVRRTTMRASEKVQSCFDARLGSLIVGVIMSVISGLAVLTCIGGYIVVNVFTSMGYDLNGRIPYYQRDYANGNDGPSYRYGPYFSLDDVVTVLIVNAVITVGLISSLLEFSFSVVLADGALKRKTGHLKAYFVYGNVKSVMVFIVSIILFITIWDNAPGYLTLLLCGINVVMTMVVYVAYKNIKKSTKGYNKFDNEVAVQDKEVSVQ